MSSLKLRTAIVRPLAVAAALVLSAAGGRAAAQTVIVRQAPAGSAVEVRFNSTVVGTGTVGPAGDVIVPLKMAAPINDLDARVYLDTCDTTRRVQIVERSAFVPPAEAGCERQEITGVFLIRRISTLVLHVGTANANMLLIQGKYSLDPKKTWSPTPTGLMLFAGGAWTRISDTPTIACGDTADCSSDGSGLAYTGGAAFWFGRYFALEGSYLKPSEASGSGSGTGFTFDSALDADVFNIVGKVGAPAGTSRIYGQGGMSYHSAVFATNQTTGGVAQTTNVKTKGWGWTFGGGMEVWIRPSVALYGEFNFVKLKGKSEEREALVLNDKMTAIVVGARVRLWR